MLLYVHRDGKGYSGSGAQEGHLDFHTAPEFLTSLSLMLLYVHRDHKDYEGRVPRTATSTFTHSS